MSQTIEFAVVARCDPHAKRGYLRVYGEDGQFTGEEIYFHLRDGRKFYVDEENLQIAFTDERIHPRHEEVILEPDTVVVFSRNKQGKKAQPWGLGDDYNSLYEELTRRLQDQPAS